MKDIKCDCGNPECTTEIMFRKGPIFRPDGSREKSWLHLDANTYDGSHNWVEVMISPKSARKLMWWMLKNFWRK